MHLIDNSTAANTQPTIGPVGPNPDGFFRPKNADLGQLATVIDFDWLNAVQNEIAAVIRAAGISLNKNTQNQMATAIQTLIDDSVNALPSVVIKTITQNGHGFTKGKVLYNASGTWTLARADALATSFSVGMVYEVVSTNVFKIIMLGYISDLPAGMSLTANTVYYLSTSVAGGLQTTRPTGTDYIKAVLITDSTTSGYFFNPQPMPANSGGGGGGGDLLAANNLDDLDDIPTARDNLGLGTAALSDTGDFIAQSDYNDFMQASELTNLLAKADNLFGLADTAQARVNLGLGTSATHDVGDFAAPSDITDLQGQIDSINTDLNNYALTSYVDAADTSLQGEIDTINTTLGSAVTNIGTLQTDVSTLQSDVSDLSTTVAGKQDSNINLTALSGLTLIANTLPYGDADNSLALTTLTSLARTILGYSDTDDIINLLNLTPGSDIQPYSPALESIAALTTMADEMIYTTGADTYAVTALTSFARTLLDDGSASAARSTLGLVIGTNVQAYDATLASLSALGTAADKIAYTTGIDTWAETSLTSFARTFLDDADAATVRTTLGLVIGTDVQAYDAILASLAGLSLTGGDILYANSSAALARLAKGASFTYLGTSGTNAPQWTAIDLVNGVSGNLSRANGGTGRSSYTYGDMLYFDNTSALNVIGISDAHKGKSLQCHGAGNPPAYAPQVCPPNMIVNGGFQVWQRGTSFAVTNTTVYGPDRWQCRSGGATTACTFSQVTGVGLDNSTAISGSYGCKVQRNSGQTGTANIALGTTLLRSMCQNAAGMVWNISFRAKKGANYSPTSSILAWKISSGTGTSDISGISNAFTGNVNTTGNVTLTTSFQKFNIQSATLGVDVTQLFFQVSMTPTGTAGADDSFTIIDVVAQLVPVGASWQMPDTWMGNPLMDSFDVTLAKCLPYCRKSFDYATTPAQNVGTGTGEIIFPANSAAATTNRSMSITYPRMRTNGGTITIYNPAASNGQVRDETAGGDCSSTTVVNQSESGFCITTVGNASTAIANALGFHYLIEDDVT